MKKYFLLLMVLLSSPLFAEPMCPTVRERLSASNYVNDDIEVYFGYACENRQTTAVFNYRADFPSEVVADNALRFSTETCKILSREFHDTDELGRQIMSLVHEGGYTFVYRHPLIEHPIVHAKTFKECIQ